MIFILASFLMVMLIVLSYLLDRKYPSQRRLIIPAVFLAMLSVAGITILSAPLKPNTMSDEQRKAILAQQPKFAEWYTDYQQDIHQIHRFTTAYQKIIQDYLDQQITAQRALNSLEDLYKESDSFTRDLDKLQPPKELNQENTQLTQGIIKSTKVYQYHVNEMIRQSISILNFGIEKGLTYKATSNNLIRIRSMEDPILLDNAKYVYKIRENLKLPKETKNK